MKKLEIMMSSRFRLLMERIDNDSVTMRQITARTGWTKENTYPVLKEYINQRLVVKKGQRYKLNLPEIDRVNNIAKKLAVFWKGGNHLNKKKVESEDVSVKRKKVSFDCKFTIGDRAY